MENMEKNVSRKKELEAMYRHYANRALGEIKRPRKRLIFSALAVLALGLLFMLRSFGFTESGWIFGYLISLVACSILFALIFYWLFPKLKELVYTKIDAEEFKIKILEYLDHDEKYLEEKILSVSSELEELRENLKKRQDLLKSVKCT